MSALLQTADFKLVVRQILAMGVQAPSGGNSQPWRFELAGNTVDVYMMPERDHEILNFKNRGTLLAHGMLIETIAIAARYFGFEPCIELLPDPKRPYLTATIHFEYVGSTSDTSPNAGRTRM